MQSVSRFFYCEPCICKQPPMCSTQNPLSQLTLNHSSLLICCFPVHSSELPTLCLPASISVCCSDYPDGCIAPTLSALLFGKSAAVATSFESGGALVPCTNMVSWTTSMVLIYKWHVYQTCDCIAVCVHDSPNPVNRLCTVSVLPGKTSSTICTTKFYTTATGLLQWLLHGLPCQQNWLKRAITMQSAHAGIGPRAACCMPRGLGWMLGQVL